MKLKNILIVVKDLEKAKTFYHDLFGLDVILDQDGNVILTEGLVLQDEKIWANFLKKEIVSEHNSSELYFEEKDLKTFAESFNRFLIISLDVLICRYSPLFRAFPALFISEEPHKSFYYPSCFRSQK